MTSPFHHIVDQIDERVRSGDLTGPQGEALLRDVLTEATRTPATPTKQTPPTGPPTVAPVQRDALSLVISSMLRSGKTEAEALRDLAKTDKVTKTSMAEAERARLTKLAQEESDRQWWASPEGIAIRAQEARTAAEAHHATVKDAETLLAEQGFSAADIARLDDTFKLHAVGLPVVEQPSEPAFRSNIIRDSLDPGDAFLAETTPTAPEGS